MDPMQAHTRSALERWRHLMLGRVSLLAILVLAVTLLLTLRGAFMQNPNAVYALLPAFLTVTAAALCPGIPVRLRRLGLIAGAFLAILGSVYRNAFLLPNAFCAHLMLVVLVALFMTPRTAWAVWGLGSIGWTAVAARFLAGEPLPDAPLFDPAVPLNWVRVIGIYAVVSAATLVAVGNLVQRMEQALMRSEALYAALTRESAEKISALQQQRTLNEQLRQSQQLDGLGTLAGGIAHEFNNLLVVMLGNAELARTDTRSAAARAALDQIHAAGERATALTQQLLTFARHHVPERSALRLDARVQAAVRILRGLVPASIEIRCELCAGDATVWASEVELDQILLNPCVNASEAMPNGGALTLRTGVEPTSDPETPLASDLTDRVYIEIEDTGSGMDEATRRRVFEPFFTTKGTPDATGLGMSTVHGIVSQANGDIVIDSAPHEGTRVRIRLPASPQGATRAAPGASDAGLDHSQTVLVADDDPAVRAVLSRQLSRHGFEVVQCADGEEALREFRQRAGEIELVISDAVMPRMGGRELHTAILKEHGEVPFLICSGYTAQTLEEDFFDHPLHGFLAKPFAEHVLVRRVRELIGRTRADETAATR